jgi:LIN37
LIGRVGKEMSYFPNKDNHEDNNEGISIMSTSPKEYHRKYRSSSVPKPNVILNKQVNDDAQLHLNSSFISQSDRNIYLHPFHLTASDIESSIPDDASSVFHILDRRINLASLPDDPTMYSLLRAWVQDNPNHSIQLKDFDIIDHSYVSLQGGKSECGFTPQRNVDAHQESIHDKKSNETKVDILDEIKRNSTNKPDPRSFVLQNFLSGSKIKRQRAKWYRVKRSLARANLKKQGITL